MPIYEYECRGCAHAFETIQKISEAPLTKCPSCGKDLLKKKISAVAFRLKGGGWYETDFKSGDKRNVAGRDDGGESKPADSAISDKKSEAKDTGATSKSTGDGASSAAGSGGSTKESTKETVKAKDTKKSGRKDSAKPPRKNKPKGGGAKD